MNDALNICDRMVDVKVAESIKKLMWSDLVPQVEKYKPVNGQIPYFRELEFDAVGEDGR